MGPRSNPLALIRTFVRIRRGRVPNSALAEALPFQVTDDLSVSYIGEGIKVSSHGDGSALPV